MYVCMYVCMHVCMYACMHACMYACMHVCMDVCMYVWMYACTFVCTHVCVYATKGVDKEWDVLILSRQQLNFAGDWHMAYILVYKARTVAVAWECEEEGSAHLLGDVRDDVIDGKCARWWASILSIGCETTEEWDVWLVVVAFLSHILPCVVLWECGLFLDAVHKRWRQDEQERCDCVCVQLSTMKKKIWSLTLGTSLNLFLKNGHRCVHAASSLGMWLHCVHQRSGRWSRHICVVITWTTQMKSTIGYVRGSQLMLFKWSSDVYAWWLKLTRKSWSRFIS